MNKTYITRGIVALVLLAAVFSLGLFFGRGGGPGGFTVRTEYEIGAMPTEELDTLAAQLDRAEAQQNPNTAPEQTQDTPATTDDGIVNINTADHVALQVLPGVGPEIAQRIIDHRDAYGPFRIIEELTDVAGIGPARFADIRDLITVE